MGHEKIEEVSLQFVFVSHSLFLPPSLFLTLKPPLGVAPPTTHKQYNKTSIWCFRERVDYILVL